MIKKILLFSFGAALILQAAWFYVFDLPDSSIWANQAKYFVENNGKQFDFLLGYGHPGGPLIEGTVLLHKIGLSYNLSLFIFLALVDSILIAAACVLSFLLTQNNHWWPIVLVTLSLNRFFELGTPTSAVSALAVVVLGLMTLWLHKKETLELKHLVLWALVAALAISTRIDAGPISFLAFILVLSSKLSWKKTVALVFGVGALFVLFDPYMLFMPWQHIQDLIFKLVYHYKDISPQKVSLLAIVGLSPLVWGSMFLVISSLFSKKVDLSLPKSFVVAILGMSMVWYLVFFTSRIQAVRYLMPMYLLWETLLPYFIFSLIPEKKTIRLFSALMMAYPIIFVCQSLYINYVYGLLWLH